MFCVVRLPRKPCGVKKSKLLGILNSTYKELRPSHGPVIEDLSWVSLHNGAAIDWIQLQI
jgi:hypothetical protein